MKTPMPTTPARDRERANSTILMVVGTVLYGLSMLPWTLMLMLSPMAYDSPGSTKLANVFIVGILGWPVAVVGGLVVGWSRRRYQAVILGLLTPLAFELVIAAIMSLMNHR